MIFFLSVDVIMESIIVAWGAYCNKQSKCHDRCRAYFKTKNFGVMIPALVLASVSGIGAIGGSSAQKCNNDANWMSIGFGAAALLSSTLITIHRYMNLSELQQEHDFFSDMFQNMANEVSLQMALKDSSSHQTYTSIDEFAKYFKRQLDNMIDKAPSIPGWVEREVEHNIANQA